MGFSRDLWPEMVEMGWTAILVPEQYGGLGYGCMEMGVVLEESGRTLTPSPLLGTALVGVTALVTAGTVEQCTSFLPAMAAGEYLLALACDEAAQHDPESISTTVTKTDSGYRITGRKVAVLDGHVADSFIVSAWTGADIALFLVPAGFDGVTVEQYPVLDTHFGANVRLDQVDVGEAHILGDLTNGRQVLERILDVGRVGASAEMLGIALEAFERTMEYLKERKQFGVPIGSFQALQHRAAYMFGEIEMCKSLVIKALQDLDEHSSGNAELASLTKAKLSETCHRVTTEAIQMHGGIGMTDDFDIGFFLKRSQILENLYGNAFYHLDRYARLRGY
jgi:acyl-CoA dehydrogenase